MTRLNPQSSPTDVQAASSEELADALCTPDGVGETVKHEILMELLRREYKGVRSVSSRLSRMVSAGLSPSLEHDGYSWTLRVLDDEGTIVVDVEHIETPAEAVKAAHDALVEMGVVDADD